jgi:hypothetical protein
MAKSSLEVNDVFAGDKDDIQVIDAAPNDDEIYAAKKQQSWKEKLQTSQTSTKLLVSGELSTLVRAVDQNATACIE